MIAALSSRRLFPILAILTIVAIGQYYVIVHHGELITYMKNKLYVQIKNLKHSNDSRKEVGGPLHILIVSYARTGSSFLGDLLQSHPESFYFFEPLHYFGNKVINDTNQNVLQFLHHLFRCQVSKIPKFLTWQKNHKAFMKLYRNARYWKSCFARGNCYNASFLDSSCSNHSAIVIKTIRMGLREAAALYTAYPDLNLKILYLVRDPRGTFNSRTKSVVKNWCRDDPKCYDPRMFCAELEDDLNVACSLLSSRPEDFIVLRFEDLARNAFQFAKNLIYFLGLDWNKEINQYLSTHTTSTVVPVKVDGLQYPYSTFRNSLAVATKWRQELTFVRAARIQKSCRKILPRMGYYTYTTSAVMKSNINYDKSLDESLSKSCPD